jgi:thymidylate synthase
MISAPYIITRTSIIDAWHEGADLLTKEGNRFNLCIHVEDPGRLIEAEVRRYDPRRIDRRVKSVYDVANTIFPPDSAFHRGSIDDFFDHFVPVYVRGQRRYRNAWGTYFLRLAQFGGAGRNQLRTIIDAIMNWKICPHAAFVLHLSSPELDRPRTMGAPCWQYAEFTRTDKNTLSLTATYRSHDYFLKALGNFVGLTRLLKFVCQHTSMTEGTLTCLSVYAHLQGRTTATRQLLAQT